MFAYFDEQGNMGQIFEQMPSESEYHPLFVARVKPFTMDNDQLTVEGFNTDEEESHFGVD